MEVRTKPQLAGLYLVINPSQPTRELFERLSQALDTGIDLLQVWDNWPAGTELADKVAFLQRVLRMCQGAGVPVLMNNNWQLLHQVELQGVHFDTLPDKLEEIRNALPYPIIAGLTVGNELELLSTATQAGFDYLSFCSVFPSPSVNTCRLVEAKTIHQSRKHTSLPLFVSGGITPQNFSRLRGLPFQGVALISGIMRSDQPAQAIKQYRRLINQHLNSIER